MSDLEICEQQNVHRLRAYRDLIHMELRDGRHEWARVWRNHAHQAVKNIRLLRSVA